MPDNAPEDAEVEMRYMAPRWVVDVIDAHVAAGIGRRPSRNKIAVDVLSTWARNQVHLANVVGRITRGNGNVPPSDWAELGE